MGITINRLEDNGEGRGLQVWATSSELPLGREFCVIWYQSQSQEQLRQLLQEEHAKILAAIAVQQQKEAALQQLLTELQGMQI